MDLLFKFFGLIEIVASYSGSPTELSFQTEDILHVVSTGRLSYQPLCRLQSTASEGVATRGPVNQLDSFALAGEDYRMFSNDVAPSHRVDSDLFGGSLADHSLPPVANRLLIGG
jgi:hypothetical protein